MKTINSIMKGFNKSITQLRKLSAFSVSEAEILMENAAEATRKADAHKTTATQAGRIADNIETLISGE